MRDLLVSYQAKSKNGEYCLGHVVCEFGPVATAEDFTSLVESLKETMGHKALVILSFRRLENPE